MAGLPERINSPFGNRPKDLPNPSPGEGMEMEAAQIQAKSGQMAAGVEMPGPAGGTQVAPSQAPGIFGEQTPTAEVITDPNAVDPNQDIDSFLSKWAEPDSSSDMAPTRSDGEIPVMDQLREAGARFRNAWTATPQESVSLLKKYPNLYSDVRLKGDEVQVKRKGDKGWSNFDRDERERISDTLDFARDAFEMVVEGGTEVAGTVAGAVPTAGTGTVPANMASGAVGAMAALNAGNFVAEKIMGIERDPERSATLENSVAGAFGAGFGWMGSALARRAATKRFLRSEGAKSMRAVKQQVDEALEDIAMVKSSGLRLDPEDGVFRLDPNVATGGTEPNARALAKNLSDTEGYQNFFNQMGDSLQGAYGSMMDRIGSFAGRPDADLGSDFVLTAKDVRAAEGKLIGSFRNLADEKLAKKPQLANRTWEALDQMKQVISDPATGKMLDPKSAKEALIDRYSVTPADAGSILREFHRVQGKMSRAVDNVPVGNQIRLPGDVLPANPKKALQLDEAIKLHRSLSESVNSAYTSGNPGKGRALQDIRNALQDDYIEMMGKVLPPGQVDAYSKSVGRYKEIMDATRNLGKMIGSEDISKDVLVKKLFEGGNSYKFMKGAKTLIEETQPELWAELSQSYFKRLKSQAIEESVEFGADGIQRTNRTFNWKKMAKQWGKVDPRVQEELTRSAGIPKQAMDSLLQLGQRYQNADVGFMAKQTESSFIAKQVKNIISLVYGGGAAQGTASANMLEGIGKNNALMKWLQSGDNLEKSLKGIKGLDQKRIKEIENYVYDWAGPEVMKYGTKIPASTQSRQESLGQ